MEDENASSPTDFRRRPIGDPKIAPEKGVATVVNRHHLLGDFD
jgi:hypothetical protein